MSQSIALTASQNREAPSLNIDIDSIDINICMISREGGYMNSVNIVTELQKLPSQEAS